MLRGGENPDVIGSNTLRLHYYMDSAARLPRIRSNLLACSDDVLRPVTADVSIGILALLAHHLLHLDMDNIRLKPNVGLARGTAIHTPWLRTTAFGGAFPERCATRSLSLHTAHLFKSQDTTTTRL